VLSVTELLLSTRLKIPCYDMSGFPQITDLTIGLCCGQDRAFAIVPFDDAFKSPMINRKSPKRVSLRPRANVATFGRPSRRNLWWQNAAAADAVIGPAAVGLLTRVGRQDGASGWGPKRREVQSEECKMQSADLSRWHFEFCNLHFAFL
jgi:hypothetical protein